MTFMEIVLISVLAAGFSGLIGALARHLLNQNAQRAKEYNESLAAIAQQGKEFQQLRTQAMAAIVSSDRENRRHREILHAETMKEMGGLRSTDAALGERAAALEAMAGLRDRLSTPSDQSRSPSTASIKPQSQYAPAST